MKKIDDIRVLKLLIVPFAVPFVLAWDVVANVAIMFSDMWYEIRLATTDYIRSWREL